MGGMLCEEVLKLLAGSLHAVILHYQPASQVAAALTV